MFWISISDTMGFVWDGQSLGHFILAIMVVIWGIRLGGYLLSRIGKIGRIKDLMIGEEVLCGF